MPESQHHFRGHHYQAQHITGPIKSLNPTKRYIAADKSSVSTPETRQDTESGFHAAYVWRSRDNRKGRHALAVSHNPQRHDAVTGPRLSNTWAQTWRGLGKMVTRYPVWDISYDVALVFTVGNDSPDPPPRGINHVNPILTDKQDPSYGSSTASSPGFPYRPRRQSSMERPTGAVV